MGVPKFYRWISERYPQINQMLSGNSILPEFDNMYLDMNGIIHACTHPNDNQTANSLTLREMILAIFRYIDRMVTEIVKPKKILFMAIDGVAPRAKLNQQRARRFRAAQDREESIIKARSRGETVDEEIMFDSNCITPGTEFMEIVGKHLRWFIRKKVKDDPIWRNLRVVFSGHDVPGEGEHKIMQFIRDLRNDPNYEPNQRHCMYGQDADLIMLGLASHEPHFALLREVVDFNFGRGGGSAKQTVLRQTKEAQFQLLHLSILREYLMLDFALDCSWAPDQERVIDDFIFMTFLVGNDFLPHLPTLDIGEHAFDLLISSYRQLMNEEAGYIVCNGEIADLPRLEKLCALIGSQEHTILKNREEDVKSMNKKKRRNKDAHVLSEEELEEMEDALERAYQAAIDESLGNTSTGGNSPVPPTVEEVDWINVSKLRVDKISLEKDEDEEDKVGSDLIVNKDYRGRYYYEKFKMIPTTEDGKSFLDRLMVEYLKGLMWVLAYYIKGCVSWTWYYPYHYGPMLQDMRDLTEMSTRFSFSLGQPFRPFQQLLGCLPPASSKLLPRPYQWLMLSDDSPVREFYPLEFGIDQDGKKNPWEAVVLLDFIDEVRLLAAEGLHCPASKLTQNENNRNLFGTVLTCVFDPSSTENYKAPSTEFGLTDIYCCQSVVSESIPSLAPGAYFKPQLVPGTTYPIAGFPSLTVLPLKGCRIEAVKVNMFGSDSKYKSVLIELRSPQIESMDNLNAELLLGRTVYVNYPQIHEAKVVAVSTEREEYRLVTAPGPDGRDVSSVVHIAYDGEDANKWRNESREEETKYLKGRGTPGSGGLVIDKIKMRLRVLPLQGLQRDPITGASKKVYATTTEADIPIQLALWAPPVHDPRFEETDELSVEKLMPLGSTVVALNSQLLGCKGRVVGPHTDATSSATTTAAGLKSAVKQDGAKKLTKRVVDIEFSVPVVDPSFGYSIANTVLEEYFSTKDLCASLQISPSVLGKLVGSIKVDIDRGDIGLNLKRNGQYQLLGYAHRIEPSDGSEHKRRVWTGADTIQIVGTVGDASEQAAAEADGVYWEYSVKAATLIFDFKARFPRLFYNLEKLPHQPVYVANQLFDGDGKNQLQEVNNWLQAQPFFKMPRTPFTTSCLCKDAMTAIEKASDDFTQKNNTQGYKKVLVKGIPVESLYCDSHRSVTDVPLPYNGLEPKLGDRVVNLTSTGVPFALRGTVVTIHTATKYVEVIFDEEFVGGKGLQGNCSQFRGRLCPWSGLLLSSRADEYKEYRRSKQYGNKSAAGAALKNHTASLAGKTGLVPSSVHVKGTVPVKAVKGKGVPEVVHHAPAAAPAPVASAAKTHAIKELLKKKDDHAVEPVKPISVAKSSALLKVLKDRTAENEAKQILSLLKQQLDVTDEEVQSSLDQQTVGVKASDGTGKRALAAAAGFDLDAEDVTALLPSNDFSLVHHPLSGVISYQPGVLPAAPASAKAADPTPAATSASAPVKKILINKEASQRVVKHQLAPNHSTGAAAPASTTKPHATTAAAHHASSSASHVVPPAHHTSPPSKHHHSEAKAEGATAAKPETKSITHILQNAKKAPAAAATGVSTDAAHAKAPAAPAAPAAPKSFAAIVAAKESSASSSSAAAPTPAAADSAAVAPVAAKTEKPKSISSLLANAKKVHASKVPTTTAAAPAAANSAESSAEPAPAPSGTAAAAPAGAKSITHLLTHAKTIKASPSKETTEKPKTPTAAAGEGKSITSLLTNAKRVPAAAATDGAKKEAPAASSSSGGDAGASSIVGILSKAKKIPATSAAVTAAVDPAVVKAEEAAMKSVDDQPVTTGSSSSSAPAAAAVKEPAKKKVSAPLVPSRVMLTKPAAATAASAKAVN